MAAQEMTESLYRVEVVDRPWSHPDGESLRRLQRQELAEMYGQADGGEPGTPPSADDISEFVIAYLHLNDDSDAAANPLPAPIPVACGALRALSKDLDPATGKPYPGDAEIKRMYVHREYRGKPFYVARAVLKQLEKKAQERGWKKLVLETGYKQQAAIKFYEREDYVRILSFGSYVASPLSLCYGKSV
ncbi:hypothetical protein F5884DRAFT_117141 [Xylogone sp. PMI_703]|nr:hypothetical protein F5884DRAFT_117141 [Xylogone sp. PMI_703]